MEQHIIEISHLNKSFGSIKAVSDLSFHVRRGELFAFLGVNGAGKSTTISIMCGQLKADSGSVIISGHDADRDIAQITRKLGVVFQSSVLDKPLSVRDNLESRAALYGITGTEFETRLGELCELLDLSELLDRSVGKLSGGQRQALTLLMATVVPPKLLLLDEHTAALDPGTAEKVLELTKSIVAKDNITCMMITHNMQSALDLGNRTLMMDKGNIIMDVSGAERDGMTVQDFLDRFKAGSGKALDNDRMLLS